MSSAKIELGHDFTFTPVVDETDTLAGYIVEGPQAEQCPYKDVFSECSGKCSGYISVVPRENRPMWQLLSENPVHVEPSIVCGCGGQHGFVRDGKYIPC